MNKDLAAQFLSAIITRNSGQRIEDDVKESLAYAETFERLTADDTSTQGQKYAVSGSDFSIKADDKSCEWEDGSTGDFTKYGFAEGKLESPVIQALRRINELEERVTFIHNALQQSAKDGYIIKNQPMEEEEWKLTLNAHTFNFYSKKYRNEFLAYWLNSYQLYEHVTFLATANNGILSNWTDKDKLFEYYKNEKEVHVIGCFTEEEVKQQIDAYYEERGGFAKHVEYLKSIGQW